MSVAELELSDTIVVFQQPEATLIPLQTLAQFLAFPLQIDPAEQSVNPIQPIRSTFARVAACPLPVKMISGFMT